MRRTNIYLAEAQAAALDEAARVAGVSRAEVVRRLIDRGSGTEPAHLEADLAAIRDSFGVLDDQSAPAAREPDQRARHLARIQRG